MSIFYRLLIVMIFVAGNASAGPVDILTFSSPELEQRYKSLSEELRCLVCQNQSLADSNAALAVDLRNKVYVMLNEGKSNDEIIDFMVERYGEFVLYRPPLKPLTWLLWFGPAILLFSGLFIAFRIIQKQESFSQQPLSDEEKSQLKTLTSQQEKDAN